MFEEKRYTQLSGHSGDIQSWQLQFGITVNIYEWGVLYIHISCSGVNLNLLK